MGITIKEIAKMANVHRSTVDKVLHNRAGVSDEVRSRIKKIIKETGYTPNSLGQALQKKSKSFRLAVLLLKVDAFDMIKDGINQALKSYDGFDIDIQYYMVDYFDEAAQLSIFNKLLKSKIDGIVLSPINTEAIREIINKSTLEGIPVVTTMNFDITNSNRLCFIGQDAMQAGAIGASLINLLLSGKGKVSIITATEPTETISYSESRHIGFEKMLKKEYPNIDIVDYIVGYDDPVIIEKEVSSLLQKKDWPDALFITGGGVSIIGKLLKKYDKEHKIKVVCFERYPDIIKLINEGIIDFTIDSNMVRQGYLAVEALMNYLVYRKQPEASMIFTDSEIIVKGSLYMVEEISP